MPLVSGFLRIAQTSPRDDRFGESAAQVETEADRMDSIIDDLLDLARLEEQGADLPDERIDVIDIPRRAAERLPSSTCAIASDQHAPLVANGSETQIDRAIFNLLLNALHHARTEVSIQARVIDGHVQVVVDDDGDGVPLEDRERILERFERGDRSRSRSTGGARIGLAITTTIAKRHNGFLTVGEAKDLSGARFILDLGPEASSTPHPKRRPWAGHRTMLGGPYCLRAQGVQSSGEQHLGDSIQCKARFGSGHSFCRRSR